MRALILGVSSKVLRGEKVDFVPQSSEVVKASGAPSSTQISLGTCQRLAITMTSHDSIYMHFQDFSPEFARTPHTLIKGVGTEAPANLLDEC